MIEILERVLPILATVLAVWYGHRIAERERTNDSQAGVTIHFFEGRVQSVTSSDPGATEKLLKALERLLQRRGLQ